jgi:PTH1 family peptidyl-tRNA hydrolase
MYLIVGLGNPEPEYSHTRHNMGFDVMNEIAKRQEIELTRTKFNGIYGSRYHRRRKSNFTKTTNFHEFKWPMYQTIY